MINAARQYTSNMAAVTTGGRMTAVAPLPPVTFLLQTCLWKDSNSACFLVHV